MPRVAPSGVGMHGAADRSTSRCEMGWKTKLLADLKAVSDRILARWGQTLDLGGLHSSCGPQRASWASWPCSSRPGPPRAAICPRWGFPPSPNRSDQGRDARPHGHPPDAADAGQGGHKSLCCTRPEHGEKQEGRDWPCAANSCCPHGFFFSKGIYPLDKGALPAPRSRTR